MNNNDLTKQYGILNTQGLDLANPATFAEFVTQAKQLENLLEGAWGAVKQQMTDANITSIKGDWGSLQFEEAELLAGAKNVELDPAVTKTVLDTNKAKAYRNLMGDLPAGVTSRTITKFVKRIKVQG